MNSMTKLVLGAMGRLRPEPARDNGPLTLTLLPPQTSGGTGLMQALASRRSIREFTPAPLPLQLLSNLIWAAAGINRPDGGRTAPSALNAQEVEVFVALPDGAYRYDPGLHALELVARSDVRRVTGYQDFVDDAPLDLVYVAHHSRLSAVPVTHREAYAHVAAGAMAQNVYLFAAAHGLGTVLRAWIDREAVSTALGLSHDQQVMLSQTVGYPKH